MKVLLCGVLILGFGYIGFCISKTYALRKKFFFCFGGFLSDLKLEVNFSSKKLEQFLSLYTSTSAEFNKMLSNYKNELGQGVITKDNLFLNIPFLSEEEKETIFMFFKTLGKSDIFNQINIIDGLMETNKSYILKCNEESKKYSTLYTKLGIIIGAFVSLLII